MDEFEQKLQRQPLRRIPADWREEILAREGRRAAVLEIGPADTAALNPRHSALNPPVASSQGLGRLAAVWVLILAVNFSARDTSPVCSGKIRAAVAGSRGGIAATAADAGGIDRPA